MFVPQKKALPSWYRIWSAHISTMQPSGYRPCSWCAASGNWAVYFPVSRKRPESFSHVGKVPILSL